MIKTKKLIPEVYNRDSRDFQVLSNTFDIVFNYLKTNIDIMSLTNEKMVDLLSTTVGFTSKHEYNNDDLLAIISLFQSLLRNKGTKKAIEDAIKILLNTQGIQLTESDSINLVEKDSDEPYLLNIWVPQEIQDIILLEDLFEYILPIGWNYKFNTYFGTGSKGVNLGYSEDKIIVNPVEYDPNQPQVTRFDFDAKGKLIGNSEIYNAIIAGQKKKNSED